MGLLIISGRTWPKLNCTFGSILKSGRSCGSTSLRLKLLFMGMSQISTAMNSNLPLKLTEGFTCVVMSRNVTGSELKTCCLMVWMSWDSQTVMSSGRYSRYFPVFIMLVRYLIADTWYLKLPVEVSGCFKYYLQVVACIRSTYCWSLQHDPPTPKDKNKRAFFILGSFLSSSWVMPVDRWHVRFVILLNVADKQVSTAPAPYDGGWLIHHGSPHSRFEPRLTASSGGEVLRHSQRLSNIFPK